MVDEVEFLACECEARAADEELRGLRATQAEVRELRRRCEPHRQRCVSSGGDASHTGGGA